MEISLPREQARPSLPERLRQRREHPEYLQAVLDTGADEMRATALRLPCAATRRGHPFHFLSRLDSEARAGRHGVTS
jgi:hypothetical protein